MTSRFTDWSDDDVIEELDEEGVGMTAWELDFLDDVKKRVGRGEKLRVGTREKLEEIATARLPGEE